MNKKTTEKIIDGKIVYPREVYTLSRKEIREKFGHILYPLQLFVFDGQSHTPIPNTMFNKIGQVRWSRDGKKVVFNVHEWIQLNGNNKFSTKIYIINEDGTDLQEITEGWGPAFSPNGESIIFIKEDGNIYILDIQKRTEEKLTNVIQEQKTSEKKIFTFIRYQSFSDNGKFILFSKDITEFSPDGRNVLREDKGIYVLDFQTRTEKKIYPLYTLFSLPRWAPDSNSIAFTKEDIGEFVNHGDGHIYKINIYTGKTQQITNLKSKGDEVMPVWSSDGKKILYKHVYPMEFVGFRELRVVNVDGTDDRVVIPKMKYCDPEFSFDWWTPSVK